MVYGMSLGETSKAETVEEGDDDINPVPEMSIARAVPLNAKVSPFDYCMMYDSDNIKVFYTVDEVKSFRTLGLEPREYHNVLLPAF